MKTRHSTRLIPRACARQKGKGFDKEERGKHRKSISLPLHTVTIATTLPVSLVTMYGCSVLEIRTALVD